MKKTKILIINNGLAGGGIERASVSLANYFADQGYAITILTLYQSDHFFSLHAAITLIEPDFSRNNLSKYAYVLKMILFARKHIKEIKPDTILAFSEWTNPYIVLANIGLSFPLYLTDRMNPLAKLPPSSELLKKYLYKKAEGIIAQSAYAKEILQKKTKATNIAVINNPVNVIDKIACETKKRIVTVGRLSPEKGHRFLIEAFAMLNSSDWELSIVGDGSERANLEKLAVNLCVADRIIFYGHLKDFRLQLSEAQIFVLPSLKEGFPNALLEAMSVPLACITTDFFQGKNEIIDNGVNGLIVKPGNIKDLASAIETLITNKTLRQQLSKNAFNVRNDFDFEIIANQYLDFILSPHVRHQEKLK